MPHRDRIKKAIENYINKQDRKLNGPTRRNLKPEKEVEKACLEWMRQEGWSIQIIESKATFDPKRQRYISQSTKAGTSDCFGMTKNVEPCFIEFKAPGKLQTFALEKNGRQQQYLISKIKAGAFGCVVDSVERLKKIYLAWQSLRGDDAKDFLLNQLPRPKKSPGRENLGF